MIVPKGKIEGVPAVRTGSSADLPALEHVYLRGEFLEATDSYVAVKVPVGRDGKDKDGALPVLAFEFARRFTANRSAPQIDASKEKIVGVPGLAGLNRPIPVKAPPTYDEIQQKFANEETAFVLAIDARMLLRVQEALGSDGVLLEIVAHPRRPVRVSHMEGPEKGVGIVMPLASSMAPPPPEPEKKDGDS